MSGPDDEDDDESVIDEAATLLVEEQRVTDRRPLAVQVQVSVEGHPVETFLTCDVAPNGLFIRTAKPYPPGTRVRLSFALPRGPLMHLDAAVAWTTRERPAALVDPGQRGMGVRFVHARPADRAALQRFFHLDRGDARRVVIVENDPVLRASLADAYRTAGLEAREADWSDQADALAASHALAVIGADAPGLAAAVFDRAATARAPVVALVADRAIGHEWADRAALFCFAKPVDVAHVVRMTRAMVR